ncbi:MAG: maleylpyruvate isomerase family mycothiol-dependent enzyme [Actinomycetota bacterium]
MAENPWPTVHAERKALAADLADLTPAQWNTPSLCTNWTVLQALAHQVATAKMTPPKFLAKMAVARLDFQRLTAKEIAVESAGGPVATLAAYRAVQNASSAPPGPKLSWLGEAFVHSEDIRRPLGITRDYPVDWVTKVIEFYSGSNVLIGGKNRVAGLTLKATDADWSHGEGPVVEGPAMSLLLATTGRKVALHELAGPGLATLAAR